MTHNFPLLAIVAGGRATRLQTNRSFPPKHHINISGKTIGARITDQAYEAGIETVVMVHTGLTHPEPWDKRFKWDFVRDSGTGTFGANYALARAIGDSSYVLTTSDIVLPAGSLQHLVAWGSRVKEELSCGILVNPRGDQSDSVGVLFDPSTKRVTDIGKRLFSSQWIFSSARWCSPHINRMLISISEHELFQSDIEFLSRLCRQEIVTVAASIPWAVDIDVPGDIPKAAQNLYEDERRAL